MHRDTTKYTVKEYLTMHCSRRFRGQVIVAGFFFSSHHFSYLLTLERGTRRSAADCRHSRSVAAQSKLFRCGHVWWRCSAGRGSLQQSSASVTPTGQSHDRLPDWVIESLCSPLDKARSMRLLRLWITFGWRGSLKQCTWNVLSSLSLSSSSLSTSQIWKHLSHINSVCYCIAIIIWSYELNL